MAEATTQIQVTPKQLGKHLRTIRRKKGLSLSEVARGAGLSRRELVAYERGKLPIPESDLWVLAGSCGVDVAELMPSSSALELTEAANATSVGDTVSQLRRGQEDAGVTQYLHTLHKLQALPPASGSRSRTASSRRSPPRWARPRGRSNRSSRRCCRCRPTRPSASGR